MVGRFVEKEYIGVLEKKFRKFDTHAPSTGEFGCGAVKVIAYKAETDKRALHLSLVIFGMLDCQTVGNGRRLLNKPGIFLRLVVCTFCQLTVYLVEMALHRVDM